MVDAQSVEPLAEVSDGGQGHRRSVRLAVGGMLSLALALGIAFLMREVRGREVGLRTFLEALAATVLALLLLVLIYRMAVLITPAASLGLWRRFSPLLIDLPFLGMSLATLALNLSIWGYLCFRYPQLPQLLPIHYTASGDVDRIGFPRELFLLPGIGLLVLLANGAVAAFSYRNKPLGVYFLAGTAVVVQLLLWFAGVKLLAVSY